MTEPLPLAGKRVLLIEDEALIAAELEISLVEAGVVCLGPARCVTEALSAAETAVMDAAIVDLVLDGQRSDAVFATLARRGIPFLVATGMPSDALDPQWRDRPVVSKPLDIDEIRGQLTAMILRSAIHVAGAKSLSPCGGPATPFTA
jgi:DNA-binding response OmpR family regulator